jgi:COX assembly protein 1
MSQDHSSPPPTAEEIARFKDAGRESRFHFRNLAEHQLRQQLKDEALEICDPHVAKFAECAKEKGLLVVWSCRHFYKDVQNCLSIHNSEEAWQKYKAANEDEIERRASMKPLDS